MKRLLRTLEYAQGVATAIAGIACLVLGFWTISALPNGDPIALVPIVLIGTGLFCLGLKMVVNTSEKK